MLRPPEEIEGAADTPPAAGGLRSQRAGPSRQDSPSAGEGRKGEIEDHHWLTRELTLLEAKRDPGVPVVGAHTQDLRDVETQAGTLLPTPYPLRCSHAHPSPPPGSLREHSPGHSAICRAALRQCGGCGGWSRELLIIRVPVMAGDKASAGTYGSLKLRGAIEALPPSSNLLNDSGGYYRTHFIDGEAEPRKASIT